MRKLLVTGVAFGLVALVAFRLGTPKRAAPSPLVEAQAGARGLFMKVEIEGLPAAAIAGVKWLDGLDAETEVIEFVDGADEALRKRPGRTKYSNITLKRGYVGNDELWKWYENVQIGDFQKKAGAVILTDAKGTEVGRYNFFEAWPCKWHAPRMVGPKAVIATEEIEFAIEKLEPAGR